MQQYEINDLTSYPNKKVTFHNLRHKLHCIAGKLGFGEFGKDQARAPN